MPRGPQVVKGNLLQQNKLLLKQWKCLVFRFEKLLKKLGKKNWKQIQVILMLQFLERHYFGLYDVLQLPLLSSDNSSFFCKSPQGIMQI